MNLINYCFNGKKCNVFPDAQSQETAERGIYFFFNQYGKS